MLIIPILATNTQIIRALNDYVMPPPAPNGGPTYLVVSPGLENSIIDQPEFIDLRIKVDVEEIERTLFIT